MQVLGDDMVIPSVPDKEGKCFFSMTLPSNTTQTFMFWADNSDRTSLTDLTAVPYTQGTVAYAAKEVCTPEDILSKGTISLKHVVTKVSLQHNGENTFSPKKGDVMTVTLPCATTYDVSNLTATGNGTYEFTHTFTENSEITGGTDLCSLYVLAPSESSDVDIFFRTHQLTISGISMPANTHITLRGDFSSKNDKWEVSEASRAEAFQSCFFNDDGSLKGEADADFHRFFSDESTIERFFNDILGMDKGSYYGSLFGHTIRISDITGFCLDMNVDDNHIFIYYNDEAQNEEPKFVVPTFNKDW